MKLLAFDTSTETISIAVTRVVDGAARVWQYSGPGGALASTQLIPQIERVLVQAQLRLSELDAIAFGQGPGSFTGLRTACSVAQGLGFGASCAVLPVDSLLALAEEARYQFAGTAARCQVMALLDARMDEMYAAHYQFSEGRWTQQQDYSLIRPEALELPTDTVLAGNVFAVYRERLQLAADAVCWPALPTAQAMLRLAPALLAAGQAVPAAQALPRYVRDKVAKTTLERETERAAR